MGSRIGWAIGLGCCMTAAALAAESQFSAAAGERKGWEQLNLRETTIAGMEVFYEQVLEPNLPFLREQVAEFADNRRRLERALASRHEIIADINRILRIADPNVEGQIEPFTSMVGAFSRMTLTLYFVTRSAAKEVLRRGGRLPNFQYDPKSDMVIYSPRIAIPSTVKPPERWELCIPVAAGEGFEESVREVLGAFGQFFGSGMASIAVHEITEMTLLRRARPTDPYWRWFSDGFANAITRALVEKHTGGDAARKFADAYDPNDCRDLEKQSNLRYWMLANFTVYTTQIPVEAESRMEQARYTYSTFEAQRLIDRNGIDCVGKILDRIAASDTRAGVDLLRAIQDVTGEDVQERLNHYQTFLTRDEGLSKYTNAYQEAYKVKDLEQLLANGLRMLELRGDVGSPGYLTGFRASAKLLVMMGHGEAGDEAMRNAMDLYSKNPVQDGRRMAMEAFVMYGLECGRLREALTYADELLRTAPDHVDALAVKMLASAQEQNLAQAQDYARRIQSLAKENSSAYQTATKVLSIDSNHPAAPKEPVSTQAEPTKKMEVTE